MRMMERLHTVFEWVMLASYGGILLSFPLAFWFQSGDIVFYAVLLFAMIYWLYGNVLHMLNEEA